MPRRGLLRHLAWPWGLDTVWLASPVLIAAVVALLSPIRPFDYFWALVQGRAIVALGRIPTENAFLYTLPVDVPFVNQPWLAELALLFTYRLAGHSGNLLVLAALLGVSFALVMDCAIRAGARAKHVALAALFALPFVALGSGVRTQMFAYPCFALLLRHAVLAPERPSLRSLAPVMVASALWSNLHGSFVLAPLIAGFRSAANVLESPRRLPSSALELAAVTLATTLNPLGPSVYLYVYRLVTAMRVTGGSDVTEWKPLAFDSEIGFGFLALVVLGGVLFLRSPSRARAPIFGLFLLLGALALKSQRFLGWWAMTTIVALPVFALRVPPRDPIEKAENSDISDSGDRGRRGSPQGNALFVAGMLVILIASIPGAPLFALARRAPERPAHARAFGDETPFRIVESLAQAGYPGNLFHAQALGGFLEWALCERGPRPVAFVDQRFELTPDALWRDYFTISLAHEGWRALLDRYGVRTLLIDVRENRNLVRAVARDPDWRLANSEFGYRLYVRR